MNVLIIDDEVLVRMGLVSMIQKSSLDCRILEATNGREALEQYRMNNPSITFVDISMPEMDGLQFIAEARKISNSRFIILTCHDELDIVRKAIKLGINDYIIKTSIDPSEIISLIREAEAEHSKDHNEMSAEEEAQDGIDKGNFIFNLYRNRFICGESISGLPERYGMEFMLKSFGVLLLSMELVEMREPAIKVISELMQDYLGGCLINWEAGEMLVLLGLPEVSQEEKSDFIKEFGERVIRSLEMYFNMEVSIGVDICESIMNFKCTVDCAKKVLYRKFYSSKPGLFIACQHEYEKVERQELDARLYSISGALNDLDYKRAYCVFNEFINSLIEKMPENINDIKNMLIQLHHMILQHININMKESEVPIINEFRASKLRIDSGCLIPYAEVFNKVMDALGRTSAKNAVNYHDKLVNKAKTLILEHINEENDLETIAGYVNLSPNYFSEIFKERTGERFKDYVVRMKIEKAKEYLGKGEDAFSIMEKLGYSNYSYFCRLLKKETGKSLKYYKL